MNHSCLLTPTVQSGLVRLVWGQVTRHYRLNLCEEELDLCARAYCGQSSMSFFTVHVPQPKRNTAASRPLSHSCNSDFGGGAVRSE